MEKRFGGRLPHWRLPGGLYFVTFRLQDALPFHHVQALRQEVEHDEARERERLGRSLTPQEQARVRQRSTRRLDRALDEGHGECHLRCSGAAQILIETLNRGTDYRLHAYAVMPNHAHALVHPDPDVDLSTMVRAWKSISARELTIRLGIEVPVWQKESFDHLVRYPLKAQQYRQYILDNPVKVGLTDWPHVGSTDFGYEDIVWPTM